VTVPIAKRRRADSHVPACCRFRNAPPACSGSHVSALVREQVRAQQLRFVEVRLFSLRAARSVSLRFVSLGCRSFAIEARYTITTPPLNRCSAPSGKIHKLFLVSIWHGFKKLASSKAWVFEQVHLPVWHGSCICPVEQ